MYKNKVKAYKRLAVVLGLVVLMSGCSMFRDTDGSFKWPWQKPTAQEEVVAPTTPTLPQDSSDMQEPRREEAHMIDALKTVYFDFDSSTLKPEAMEILKSNAEWLKVNPAVEVQLEGHCDSRGTIEYNYNLGQRRAESVRQYLVKIGCEQIKIHTISYGEERPVDPAENEDAWAKNRRAQFLVYND